MSDDPRQAQLRQRLRRWLDDHLPFFIPSASEERGQRLRQWQSMLHGAGWMGLAWPKEYGGQGGDIADQALFNQELVRAKAPSPPGIIGLQTVGPTLLEYGTEEQRRRFLHPILDARHVWCQGFSEPGAGSDLASLRTAAVLDRDHFVVNGQKVWTSYAHDADWCAVLVRTTPGAAHRGISYMLVDMRTPGITVRPIEQISGDAEFNEVYFDDVRIPRDNLLGELDGGWRVAMSTLQHERAMYVVSRSAELRIAFDDLVAEVATGVVDDRKRRVVGECEVLLSVLEAQSLSTLTRLESGEPGDISAVEKLLTSEIEQSLFSSAVDLFGPYAPTSTFDVSERSTSPRWVHDYLASRAATIHGGTAQILRNSIAQRLLALPRS